MTTEKQTGSTSNGVYAHAQKEVVKNGSKCYRIVEIFDSLLEVGDTGLLNQMALSELYPNTRKLPFLSMRT